MIKRISTIVATLLLFVTASDARSANSALDEARDTLEKIDTVGDSKQSVIVAKRYLILCARNLAPQSIPLAECRTRVAQAYTESGLLRDADALLQLALPVLEKASASHPMALGYALSGRGYNSTKDNQWPQAETDLRRAVALFEPLGPSVDGAYAAAIQGLADVLNRTGKRTEVAALIEKGIARTTGKPNLGTQEASLLGQSARLDLNQNRLEAAEIKARRALALMEGVVDVNSSRLLGYVQLLQDVTEEAGQFSEALVLSQRFLRLAERHNKQDNFQTAEALNGLAITYRKLERYDDAEPLLRRAVAISEKISGTEDLQTASHLNNLGFLMERSGRAAIGEPYYRRALAIKLAKADPANPTLATGYFNLGNALLAQGKFEEAEGYLLKARTLELEIYGEIHTRIADTALALGTLELKRGKALKAQSYLAQSASIRRKLLGQRSNLTAISLFALADAELALGDAAKAWATASEGLRVYQSFLRGLEPADAAALRPIDLDGILKLATQPIFGVSEIEQRNTAFLAMQIVNQSTTALAVAQLNGRFASTDPALQAQARLRESLGRDVRLQQSVVARLYRTNDEAKISEAQNALAVAEAAFDQESRALEQNFPLYSKQASQLTVDLAHIMTPKILAKDEAYLQFAQTDKALHIMLITRHSYIFKRIDLGRSAMQKRVAALRKGLEISTAISASDLPEFDVIAAHQLYRDLIAPVMQHARGIKNIIITTDGPLSSLPLSIFVSRAPAQNAYRDIHWFANDVGMSYAPSAASITAWRQQIKPSVSPMALLAFADPSLHGGQELASFSTFSSLRGNDSALPDATLNARAICRLRALPDTQREAQKLADHLGIDRSRILRSEAASDSGLAKLNSSGELARYRVLLFATHGLMSNTSGMEPALVLTPGGGCDTENADEDGMLVASEISRLTLDADWVILSGCNTAASDFGSDQRPLTGLARAFFAAGARRLLVSHWSIDSAATTDLMAELFDTNGKANNQTLQRAMAKMRASRGALSYRAHPAFWAPFVIVGDGQ
ncbi:MAG: CHAT domain-containing tetratricopeptide repeat protein [Chakrabartia sp.]